MRVWVICANVTAAAETRTVCRERVQDDDEGRELPEVTDCVYALCVCVYACERKR